MASSRKAKTPPGNDTFIPDQKAAAKRTKEKIKIKKIKLLKHSVFFTRSRVNQIMRRGEISTTTTTERSAYRKRAMAAPARRPLRGPAVAMGAPLSELVGEPEAPVFEGLSPVLVTSSVLVEAPPEVDLEGAAVVEEPRPVELPAPSVEEAVGITPVDCETVGRVKALDSEGAPDWAATTAAKAMTRVEARMLTVVWRMIGDRRDWLQVELQAINR
ncbi:hypothetical protein BDW42DRAFT_164149 [Aspergillus taichungensis]|uniref:Uncharacterized protein n=1 Tax=Aspergillus taichungensis TaxID=482145 RepID=A0A2J5I1W1_9EURO|nr:hypothetical protein BDW42DRAFT_164149 [Aspergillus taichungensis]